MPTDEPSKSMLYAALKLRLSLVGSMLGTICSSDTTALDWTTLLMQLICSGAVDRQTDSRSACVHKVWEWGVYGVLIPYKHFNPRHACTARVTVLGLCMCVWPVPSIIFMCMRIQHSCACP